MSPWTTGNDAIDELIAAGKITHGCDVSGQSGCPPAF